MKDRLPVDDEQPEKGYSIAKGDEHSQWAKWVYAQKHKGDHTHSKLTIEEFCDLIKL